jgi:tetratricopeptide (TPR) repeat protein
MQGHSVEMGVSVEPIVAAFANALVAAMATDTWEHAHAALANLWQRIRPAREVAVLDQDLSALRGRVLVARRAGDSKAEQALTLIWQGKVQQLLLDEAVTEPQLRQVLQESLLPALQPADQARIGQIVMTGSSHDASTFNQVAGNQVNFQLPPASPPPPVTCTLPADVEPFTGRRDVVDVITGSVAAVRDSSGATVIHAIDGMPGVGKTALAVHVGHLTAGLFPDRQLFLDLHAHTPGQKPTEPSDALATLLAADGLVPEFIPPGLEERSALWRDRMKRKRILLILDNAAGSNQVMPLLPGPASCLVLVTSRRYLGDLSPAATSLQLGILSPAETAEMFQVLAPRIQSEHPKTAELAALCGNLPLAVSLLARIFTKHPSWTIDDLIRETRARLLTAAAEDRSIAAAFQLSYQVLEPSRQSFFRLLGQFPGTVLDAYSAAALADVSLGRAVAHLDGLHSDRLFEEVAYRRYRMHDLIREYARSLATAGDSDDSHGQAVERILDYYQYTAGVSSRYLSRWSRPPAGDSAPTPAATPPIGDGRQALAWFAAEDSNLMACINYAARNSKFARTVDLTSAIAAYLGSNGPRTRAIASHTSAVAAARRLGRHLDEANALHDLGAAQYLAEDFTASADSFRRALELYRHLGNRLGEANALNQLGTLHRTTHDYENAAQAQQQALDLYRGSGDTLGEANALAEQGIIHYLADEYQDARPELQDALNLYRGLGNPLGEAHVLIYLGAVPPNGDLRDAARHLRQALEIYGSYDDRLRQRNLSTCMRHHRVSITECWSLSPGAG